MAHCRPQPLFPGLSITRDLETNLRTVLLSNKKPCPNCAMAALECCRVPPLGLLSEPLQSGRGSEVRGGEWGRRFVQITLNHVDVPPEFSELN